MVGHHAPREQRISFAVKPQQCSLGQFGNPGNHELAVSVSLVERGVNDADAVVPGILAISFLTSVGKLSVSLNTTC
jgi:hypothetical protein